MARVLSSENQELLRTIVSHEPVSLKELEEVTGCKAKTLSRRLRDMARYGIEETSCILSEISNIWLNTN